MRTRKILAIAIIVIMFLALFVGIVKAVTLPGLNITSNQYNIGDKMTLEEASSVEVGKTLQLYSIISHGNDVMVNDDPDSLGMYVDKTNVEEVTWSSSDATVATVSNAGLVTGKKAGTTTITATTTDTVADTKTATVEITVISSTTPVESGEDWTDMSKVTFKVEDIKSFNIFKIIVDGFTAKDGHYYSVYITQDPSYTFSETSISGEKGYWRLSYDKDKKVHYRQLSESLDAKTVRMVTEGTKDIYLVIIEQYYDAGDKYKMVLKPTKIEKPTLIANLGGGYIESWNYSETQSEFVNVVKLSADRKITYKLGEVTDNAILNAISKKESDGFTRLLSYAKADKNSLETGSFNFGENDRYTTDNIAKATGKITYGKYYYIYTVANTANGKYVPVEDVVVFNGGLDGLLTHFAFAGSATSETSTASETTTNPTSTTGDISIATKKIPQTGATPVFMIILGSSMLIAVVFVMANKKYRNLK